MNRTFEFIANHPLGRLQRIRSLARWAGWQIRSRTRGDVEVTWIGGLKLIARTGMTGITGNIYVGLHEFVDMAFLLHFLRPGDSFFDVGANVGSYSLLASGLGGAKTEAFEPDPGVFGWLQRNIALNGLGGAISAYEVALGPRGGEAAFTIGLDTINHVVTSDSPDRKRRVTMHRLDDYLSVNCPTVTKIDVEGYEDEVLLGAEQFLKEPSLQAMIIETVTAKTAAILTAANFTRVHYDPFKRRLSVTPSGICSANQLFVRDFEVAAKRLNEASSINVWGIEI